MADECNDLEGSKEKTPIRTPNFSLFGEFYRKIFFFRRRLHKRAFRFGFWCFRLTTNLTHSRFFLAFFCFCLFVFLGFVVFVLGESR